jgi:hypothetical protein
MKIAKATQQYESWLANRLVLIDPDIKRKHKEMRKDVFSFLRATFYRWMQRWPDVCPDEDRAPQVLSVGDLHVENFGTWRDVEGRMVWGINDFDEAYELPYTSDLIRLSASAHIAIQQSQLRILPEDACGAILAGYRKGLKAGGKPFVLAEEHAWLRQMVSGVLRDPVHFWGKMAKLPDWKGRIPKDARRALERLLPEPGLEYRIAHRIAGLGSLGRERYVAIACYRGAQVAREAKALAPSACVWSIKGGGTRRILYQKALDESIRAIDPFVHFKSGWIVRRLAPDCSRIELSAMPEERDETNIHLGSRGASKAIPRDLDKRPRNWLHQAAARMVKATNQDWREYRG